MPQLLLFNKPYLVVSQFTQPNDSAGASKQTLADYISVPDVYPAGRLDYHSEGLLLLTDDGTLQAQISNPATKVWKYYWAQVEGVVTDEAVARLQHGLQLKDGPTLPAKVTRLNQAPAVWLRDPPVSKTRAARCEWLEIAIHEGRNRQVRRMCAAVDLPVLRLIRYRIGEWQLEDLAPGEHRRINVHLPQAGKQSAGKPKKQRKIRRGI